VITRPMLWLREEGETDALAREIAVAAGFETDRALVIAWRVSAGRPKLLAALKRRLGGAS
jgi:hypothetical protein